MKVVLFLLLLFFLPLDSKAESFNLCPLCSISGNVICPSGFEPACESEVPYVIEPKCIFYGNKYMPGCFKLVKIEKIDLGLSNLQLSPGTMVEVIGGGETYTLNRETIGCKKL